VTHVHELTVGRTFGVAFEHGEDFFAALTTFCQDNRIRHGYIPMFLAGFSQAGVVGACDKLDDPGAPVWGRVHLTNVEAVGCGTLAYDTDLDRVVPHIHASLGDKARSAVGYTSCPAPSRLSGLPDSVTNSASNAQRLLLDPPVSVGDLQRLGGRVADDGGTARSPSD
jgi:predicted DNA-binding protein with PD1-like motif